MRLTDIAALVAERGARRHLEKNGSLLTPLSLGFNAVDVAGRAAKRYHDTEEQAHAAATQQLAPDVAKKHADWKDNLMGGLAGTKAEAGAGTKDLAWRIGGKAVGVALGTIGASLLKDMMAKAKSSWSSAGASDAREAIIKKLKQEDPVLSHAKDEELMGAYHTMTRFAPTLSTDVNAVRSFLRQAVMSGSGPDYMSIKLLADSERAVTGKGKE